MRTSYNRQVLTLISVIMFTAICKIIVGKGNQRTWRIGRGTMESSQAGN